MLDRKRSTGKRAAQQAARPAAQRWRSRAWFSLAAVVVALAVLAVGGVGVRALKNEEAAVARELSALATPFWPRRATRHSRHPRCPAGRVLPYRLLKSS